MGTGGRRGWLLALAGLAVVALVLRLWGNGWGLPFTYNLDERNHFVPKAVGFLSGDLDPRYQLNPAGYSYALSLFFAVWFQGYDVARAAYHGDPASVWTVARLASAVLGTVSVLLTALAGARLFGRPAGLLAGGLMAVAFLPAFYAHQAINDAPTLAPVALALLGSAMALRSGGRTRDFLVAGVGAGLAAGFKYNAGVILLCALGAAAALALDGARGVALRGAVLAGVAALLAFLLSHPYALLDLETFREALRFLADYNRREPLVGESETSGFRYYAWTLTWGLGWVPSLLALLGAAWLVARERRAALVLVPCALVFLYLMGSQGRFFGRYVLPVVPLLCLFAGYGGVALVRALSAARPRLAPVLGGVLAVAALVQGVVWTVHSDLVLSREDTRTTLRGWMRTNVPADQPVVFEPTMPIGWYVSGAHPEGFGEPLWERWQRSRALVRELGREHRGARQRADFQNYVETLFPGMLDVYRREGACWYVRSSTQSGRAAVNPERVPEALAFYRRLEREADVRYTVSPFARDADPLPFQFDFSFNYGPLAYERPGPVLTVYRLRRCG